MSPCFLSKMHFVTFESQLFINCHVCVSFFILPAESMLMIRKLSVRMGCKSMVFLLFWCETIGSNAAPGLVQAAVLP